LLRTGTRVVFIDRPPGNIDADVVMLDNIGGTRRAVEHLLAHGHTRIAFIGDDASIFTATDLSAATARRSWRPASPPTTR
jgi:LacI family transcriptional regulator